MLLTISTTRAPATDLGFLLHKHPDRVQAFSVPFGTAHVFYPEATDERCTAALLLDVDPVGLVRRGQGRGSFALAPYVNDRPYVASSFLAVALNGVFKSAMAGTCKERPAAAAAALPLEASMPAVPARGGEELVRRLFEPLGYEVEVTPHLLDAAFPEWGDGRHVALTLRGEVRLADLLTHLYVLLGVLDGEKHYWVGDDEIAKLLRRGAGWLPDHPARELITNRYLKRRRHLVEPALEQLREEAAPVEEADDAAEPEEELEERVSLRDQRHGAVLAALKASGARRVLDLGCGPGALTRALLRDGYDHVCGADVSTRALQIAARRMKLEDMSETQRAKVSLVQSPLTYRDHRLRGYDAAVLMEVIEHFDMARLWAVMQNVFGSAQPRTVIVTTPNVEYNVRWETLEAGKFRHGDHRFEWTRAEFRAWSEGVGARFDYRVRYLPVGPDDPEVGPPTQMGIFER